MKWGFSEASSCSAGHVFFGILQLEPESLFMHLQGTATNSCPEPDEFIPQTHIL
jgi:hypothetical protein